MAKSCVWRATGGNGRARPGGKCFALTLSTHRRTIHKICVAMKTLFTAMLTVSLMGSVYANTSASLYKLADFPDFVYGVYEQDNARDGFVRVFESGESPYETLGTIYGGYSANEGSSAMRNSVIMTGGTVSALYGGYANPSSGSHSSDNTVTMTGGTANTVWGGYSLGSSLRNSVVIAGGKVTGDVYGCCGQDICSNNKVYITGGVIEGSVIGAYCPNPRESISTSENEIHLVGVGASISVNGESYEGHELELKDVRAEASITVGEPNSIDIYGTGVSAKSLDGMQLLKFHITEAQLNNGTSPMITLEDQLDLAKVEMAKPELSLEFDALSEMEWQPGTSVTLVSDALGIKIDESLLNRKYNICSHENPETVLATAKLVLEQGQGTTRFLKLVVPGNVPEPATGTLSLLALAALAARRRKK